jgi:hypothetical protein
LKRDLVLILAVAACTMVPLREAAAEMPRAVHAAAPQGVAVEADYDPEAGRVAMAPDLDAVLDYFDSEGGFMAALRYVVLLLFSQ